AERADRLRPRARRLLLRALAAGPSIRAAGALVQRSRGAGAADDAPDARRPGHWRIARAAHPAADRPPEHAAGNRQRFSRRNHEAGTRDRGAEPAGDAQLFRSRRQRTGLAPEDRDRLLHPLAQRTQPARTLAAAAGALPERLVPRRVVPSHRLVAGIRARRDRAGAAGRPARARRVAGRGGPATGLRLRDLPGAPARVGDASLLVRGGALGTRRNLASETAGP